MPEKFPHIPKQPKDSLKPHQLYSSQSANSYHSNSDVFEIKSPQKSTQTSPKTYTYTFSYNYTPATNKSSSTNIQITKPNLQERKNDYIPESKYQKQETIFQTNKKKEIFHQKPALQSFRKYVIRNETLYPQNTSLKQVVPTVEKEINYLNFGTKENGSCLRVEEGDFVINLNYVNKSGKKFAIAMYKGEEISTTNNNFFVFRARNEILNRYFLELLIKDQRFDDKLAFLAFKFSKNNQITWDSFINNFFLNIPSLKIQEELLEKRKALQELIEVKQSICKELDEWMKSYFYSLSKKENLIAKNFKELFSIDKRGSSAIPKLKDFKNQYGKFIFSNFRDLIIENCRLCNHDFCKADKLLLSAEAYGEEERQHILNLWLGCEGFASSYKLIPLTPHKTLGIPYGYWLLRENQNNLVKNIPSITSKRSVSIIELRNCNFAIHSEEKIREFNSTCVPIFEYQKLLEEEIYKLTKLQEGEVDIVLLKTFSKKLSWDLSK